MKRISLGVFMRCLWPLIFLCNSCGPRLSTREINPVIYIHKVDSNLYAARINQGQRTFSGRGFPFSWDTNEKYYPTWIILPDTQGVFRGSRIGRPMGSLKGKEVSWQPENGPEKITMKNGSIHFSGMRFKDIRGRYQYVVIPSDPCAENLICPELLRRFHDEDTGSDDEEWRKSFR